MPKLAQQATMIKAQFLKQSLMMNHLIQRQAAAHETVAASMTFSAVYP